MRIVFCLVFLSISTLLFAQKTKVPFTGVRYFELDKGSSGSGTPYYYIDILKNGDVIFGYQQVNKADGTITAERVNVGKYRKGVYKVQFQKF